MNPVSRFFLVVEGTNDTYPNYTNATVRFLNSDPAEYDLDESFISSPLFSLSLDFKNIPEISKVTSITFLMVPKIFPNILELFQNINDSCVWFSLGLANLVIFECEDKKTLSQKTIDKLTKSKNLTGYEVWNIKTGKIVNTPSRIIKISNNDSKHKKCKIKLSSKMPLHLKFVVSEFILSVNKFLKASGKFTPYYFDKHCKIIAVIGEFCDDLSFLSGNKNFNPSQLTLDYLGAKDKNELYGKLKTKGFQSRVSEVINDRHGKIIQFNSSLSYIYSQAYSGTFPIFDHIGIVRRHSLLGLGSAISALYELMIQLEAAFVQIPFEDLFTSEYHSEFCPQEYIDLIVEPTLFDSKPWKKDPLRLKIAEKELSKTSYNPEPIDYYNRLSFFSGRLGFREYEFGATAAIQVTVEAHALPWHIINYTHEIIHSHVRYLLKQLYMVPNSSRKNRQDIFLEGYLNQIDKIYKNYNLIKKKIKVTYYDYFVIVLLKFIINAPIFGSLSTKSNADSITSLHSRTIRSIPENLPGASILLEESLEYTKDITEIFVHIIDYNYIYKQQLNVYLMSIWTSWSTIPAVSNDLNHYVLRSLIIIGLNIEAAPEIRFDDAQKKFKQLLVEMGALRSNVIFTNVLDVLNDPDALFDLKYRYINCAIIGDLVNSFFVGKLEKYLNNADQNILPNTIIDDGIPISYTIQTNSFSGDEIKSKVRFVLDQLGREVFKKDKKTPEDIQERTSAWLLLSLSSFNYHD